MVKKRVVVAMSGGVDSSVAAALLKKQGREVIGMTMCFNLPDKTAKRPACCGLEGIEDARRVAYQLGIKHYVVNMQKSLEEYVIQDFVNAYAQGRTPNPCVRCNQFLKFGVLLKKALALGADFLATGHYARVVRNKAGGFLLKKGYDPLKDQSYFLYRLDQEQLKRVLFPLGNYTKVQVRALAAKFGLATADKTASQEICFLPGDDYRAFLAQRLKKNISAGDIVDTSGNILGRHKGVANYTIGQRQGLGIAKGYPIYVVDIDAKANRIVVGSREEAFKTGLLVKEPHFILRPLKKKIAAKVKIRYNHKAAAAQIIPFGRTTKIQFKKAQFAVTPGQSAVIYDGDTVLGGGIIEKVLSLDEKNT